MSSTEQQEIDDYKQVEAFLASEPVKRAFRTLNEENVAAYKASTSPEERESIHARFVVLDSLSSALLRTMDAGKLALAAKTQREAREEFDRRQRERRRPTTR